MSIYIEWKKKELVKLQQIIDHQIEVVTDLKTKYDVHVERLEKMLESKRELVTLIKNTEHPEIGMKRILEELI